MNKLNIYKNSNEKTDMPTRKLNCHTVPLSSQPTPTLKQNQGASRKNTYTYLWKYKLQGIVIVEQESVDPWLYFIARGCVEAYVYR